MRSLLVIALMALTGCSSSPPPLPKQPDAPTSKAVVTTLGADLDKTDHRVGAALVAIERNADKPKVVVAESRLAQSYLPPVPENDVAFSMARAAKGDELDYKKQMAFGRTLAAAVSVAWERLEANQAEAARVSQLKDARIVELTKAVEQAKKDAASNLWTLAGIAVAVLGAVAMVFAGPRIGATLLASGAAIGAFPLIVDSEYFSYIAGTTLALAAGLGIYWLWDHVRDSANAPYEPPQK
jgi:hypothetical protein